MAILRMLDLGVPVLAIIASLAYLVVGVIYRFFFHPLRRIPGPKLAAITYWYEIYYDVVLPGHYNFKILELHQKYGPIIRINPDEVHVADPEWLPEIYGARKRNRLYEPSLDTADSVAGTMDYEQHKIRRQAFVNFFSPPTVRRLEPLLAKKRDILSEAVEKSIAWPRENGETDCVLNLSDLFFAYFYDIIQEYAFAISSNVMLDPKEARRLRNNSNNLLMQVNFTRHFAFVNDVVALLPKSLQRRLTPPGVVDLHDLAVRVRKNVDEVLKDEKTAAVSTEHQSIFYTIRDDPSLPESEKHPLRLQREGWFVVVAGSDTPSRVLAITMFHLLSNPEYLSRLREELKSLGDHATLEDLEDLPFLNASITEGARLGFGLSRRNSRVAPEDTLQYKGYVIPPGYPVSTSTLSIHGNAAIFPDPFAFNPQRWLSDDAADKRKYLGSFGFKGPRSCLGFYLAQATLRLAIAACVRFEFELFETSIKDIEYRHDFQMCQGDLNSKGVRVVVRSRCEH